MEFSLEKNRSSFKGDSYINTQEQPLSGVRFASAICLFLGLQAAVLTQSRIDRCIVGQRQEIKLAEFAGFRSDLTSVPEHPSRGSY